MFSIDAMSRQPIYEQLIEQLERLVLTGALAPGDQVPSVRGLSVRLSVNPNTIQKAYSELDRRGILCTVPGRGCFVSENALPLLSESRQRELPTLKRLARELALAGVDKERLLAAIEEAYALPHSNQPKEDGHD